MKHHSLFLLLALAAIPASAPAQEEISKVNGSIDAEAGQRYGDLDTVNGSIRVSTSAETGNIETVNGGVQVGERARTGSISTVNGKIRLGSAVVAGGGVETVNGSIFIDRGSEVQGNVKTVNGAIGLVQTRVSGDVDTVNGDVTVGVGSLVRGGLHIDKPSFRLSLTPARKPRVIIGPDAVVEGALTFERQVVLYVHRSARTGPVSGAEPIIFDGDTAPDN